MDIGGWISVGGGPLEGKGWGEERGSAKGWKGLRGGVDAGRASCIVDWCPTTLPSQHFPCPVPPAHPVLTHCGGLHPMVLGHPSLCWWLFARGGMYGGQRLSVLEKRLGEGKSGSGRCEGH